MARLAFVFPGQGSQSVGMGAALAAASPAAAAVFAHADGVLHEQLARLAWEGPAEKLDLTVNAQPALLATSIAFLAALRERWRDAGLAVEPSFCAGHSMGQYSALVASGVLELADALRLVRERGRAMQASGEGRSGAMAAILGLDDQRIAEAVASGAAHGLVGVANRNAPGQVVLSGERAAIEAAMATARTLGARKVVLLPVSVAAHSPLMADAARQMERALAGVPFKDPRPPLVANVDGAVITTAAGARRELIEHLTSGVDWIAAVEAMARAGVDTFVEVGPGRILTSLIKRIAPDARSLATADDKVPDGLAVPFLDAPHGEPHATLLRAGGAS